VWPAAGFEVRAIVEGIIDDRQDLVVLRRAKPASGARVQTRRNIHNPDRWVSV